MEAKTIKEVITMAKNGPIGHGRIGPIKDRSQFFNPLTDRWQKRDKDTGRIMDVKADPKPFKDIRREKQGGEAS